MVTEKLIAAAIAEKKTPKEMADAINAAIRAQSAMVNLNIAARATENEYRKAMDAINGEIKSVKDKCPHLTRTYHPDPSGNNDSYHECDSCGKTF